MPTNGRSGPDGEAWRQLRQRTRIAKVAVSAAKKAIGDNPELDADGPEVRLICEDLAGVLAAIGAMLPEGSADQVT